MKLIETTSLIALLTATTLACGGGTEPAPGAPPAPTGDPAPQAPDAGTTPPPAVKPTACSVPLVTPACGTTKAAPTDPAAITTFVKEGAVALRCDDGAGGAPVWDLRPLVQLYGDQKMFMVGEVHGTNEIGIVSSLLLDQLASQGLVNIVASELPMDFEAPLQRYIDTGRDPMAEQLVGRGGRNFFGAILTKKARELFTKGVKLKAAAVDIPFSPAIAVTAIQDVATKLTTQKDAVLTTLPTSAQEPPSAADITAANAYFDHITANKTAICAELSPADCDRLVAMTHALWASTLAYDRQGDMELWFARREEVIYYNLKTKMAAASDRMFLHMGAAHTNKYSFSGGSRMANEHALTKGQVFSVAPAYGEGSVIWYGQDQQLPADPVSITRALTNAPAHPMFVSTTRTSLVCEANPVGAEIDVSIGAGGTRGQLYDGYIHYGLLTSERRPSDTKLDPDDEVLGAAAKSAGAAGAKGAGAAIANEATLARLADFRARVLEKERAAIAAGVLTRPRRLAR